MPACDDHLFAFSAWIGSSIPRNSSWVEASPEEEPTIPILVGSNGIHTEIVMPITTQDMNWNVHFPATDLSVPDPGGVMKWVPELPDR